MYVGYGKRRLFHDFWPKANEEDGELPLIAMSTVVDGAILGEGVEFSFGYVKFEMNQNTNSLKLSYMAVLLILYCDTVVIIHRFFF